MAKSFKLKTIKVLFIIVVSRFVFYLNSSIDFGCFPFNIVLAALVYLISYYKIFNVPSTQFEKN